MTHIKLFDRVSGLSQLERNAQGWKERSLRSGERLFEQGDEAGALYVVCEGQVGVEVDGASIDELGPGESLGEASVFSPTERRSASAVARTDGRVLALQRTRVMELRRSTGPTYDWLLEAALSDIWARLERRDRELVALGGQSPPPPRGMLSTLWRRLRGSGSKPPDPMTTLARVATLGRVPPSTLETLAIEGQWQQVPADRALFLQGEVERALYVLGAGDLAIVRELVPGDPQELVGLAPGEVLGAGGFVAGQPRSASAVARTDCWVFMLSRESADELPRAPRRSLYEALLATLRAQLHAANDLVASRPPAGLAAWGPQRRRGRSGRDLTPTLARPRRSTPRPRMG